MKTALIIWLLAAVFSFLSLADEGTKIPLAARPEMVALSRDGSTLAYFDSNLILRVIDTQNGQLRFPAIHLLDLSQKFIYQLEVSNDGAIVALLDGAHHRVQLISMSEDWQRPVPLEAATFALSDDGRYLANKDPRGSLSFVRTTLAYEPKTLFSRDAEPSRFSGALQFMPGKIRQLIDTPSAEDQDRRLRFVTINAAQEIVRDEVVGNQELVRVQGLQYITSYPPRRVDVSGDGRFMLTLGKSVAEVWDYRQPNSPLAFAVQPEDGAGGKYRPVENAALSADGAYFATVYRTGAIVSRTDGESVAMYKEAPHARTRLHKAAVAVRFSLTNELLIARAGVSHLIRYPAPGCGAAVASDAP